MEHETEYSWGNQFMLAKNKIQNEAKIKPCEKKEM